MGVVPAEAFERRAHLFDVLEGVFPVRFEPRDAGSWRDLDAVIACPGPRRLRPPGSRASRLRPSQDRDQGAGQSCGSPSRACWIDACAVLS